MWEVDITDLVFEAGLEWEVIWTVIENMSDAELDEFIEELKEYRRSRRANAVWQAKRIVVEGG